MRLVILAVIFVSCGAPQWSGTYLTNGQEYHVGGGGDECPKYAEVRVGRTSASVNSNGGVNYGAPIYMRGELKAGSCEVRP